MRPPTSPGRASRRPVGACGRVGVVIPMYRTASQVEPLLQRLETALDGHRVHVVMVDDHCPDDSADAVRRAARGRLRVTILEVRPNVGQHAAVMFGLRYVEGDAIVVMDGDLQDRPEDAPTLVRSLLGRAGGAAVCAARSGQYEPVGRRITARVYRAAAHLGSRGRIPRNAGMFLAMNRTALAGVVDLRDPFAPLVPSLARAGADVTSITMERRPRTDGASGYGSWRRLRVAIRGLLTISPAAPALARRHRRRWERLDVQVAVEHLHEATHRSEPGAGT